MGELAIRFLIGGLIVSIFAAIGDVLRPKSFAGLFDAAPSVALATLTLTVANDGSSYAATESMAMAAGAIALFVYAQVTSWVLMKRRPSALATATAAMPVWFAVALLLWQTVLGGA